MTPPAPPRSRDFDTLSKRPGFALSVAAFALSAYNFADAHIFGQHVLRAAVVALDSRGDTTVVRLLLVNEGKHQEILYSARLLFNEDRYGRSRIGPLVLKPGEARVDSLSEIVDLRDLREDETIPRGTDGLPLAVEFVPVNRAGEIPENGTVYGFTQWRLSGNKVFGAAPRPTDRSGLVKLEL